MSLEVQDGNRIHFLYCSSPLESRGGWRYCSVSSWGKVMSYRSFSDASSWRCRRLLARRAASRHGRARFFSLPCETLASCPSTASSECKCWCWEEEEKQSKGEEKGKMNRTLTQDGKILLLLMLELASAMSKLLQKRYKRKNETFWGIRFFSLSLWWRNH